MESRDDPVILHAYRFLGQFPWHKNSVHPWRELWWSYASRSLWSDLTPRENKGLFFALERIIYKITPKSLFLPMFKLWQKYRFRELTKSLKEKKENV